MFEAAFHERTQPFNSQLLDALVCAAAMPSRLRARSSGTSMIRFVIAFAPCPIVPHAKRIYQAGLALNLARSGAIGRCKPT